MSTGGVSLKKRRLQSEDNQDLNSLHPLIQSGPWPQIKLRYIL